LLPQQIDQPTLGLQREYLAEGLENEIVQAYHSYQIDTAVLYGANRLHAEADMMEVLNLEIEIAKISIPKEERRNMTLMHNPITIREFQHLFPIHDWVGTLSDSSESFLMFLFQYKYFNNFLPQECKVSEDEVIIVTDFVTIIDDFYGILKKTPNR